MLNLASLILYQRPNQRDNFLQQPASEHHCEPFCFLQSFSGLVKNARNYVLFYGFLSNMEPSSVVLMGIFFGCNGCIHQLMNEMSSEYGLLQYGVIAVLPLHLVESI